MSDEIGSIEEQRQKLDTLLGALKTLITQLPKSLPNGRHDGCIARYMTATPIDEDEGAYYSFNKAWENVFQHPADIQDKRVQRGQYGLIMAYNFIKFYSTAAGIEAHNCLHLLAQRAAVMVEITRRGIASASASPVAAAGAPAEKRTSGKAGISESEDGEFEPHVVSDASEDMEPEEDVPRGWEIPDDVLMGKRKDKITQKKKKSSSKPAKKKQRVQKGNLSGTSGSEADAEEVNTEPDILEIISTKPGRPPTKSDWAYEQFEAPIAARGSSSKLVWKFNCKWCKTYRTSARSHGCVDFSEETLDIKSSNFITHVEKCKHLPDQHSLSAWTKREAARAAGVEIDTVASEQSGPHAQRSVIKAFTDRGALNPAKQVTRRHFRQLFVKAIVEDDLPFRFGEKKGVRKLLEYLLPFDYPLPSHQTVRRDIDRLHSALERKLVAMLKKHDGMVCAASDIWTSRNMVFAFSGSVLWWIDSEWTMWEVVMDLIPLDGDHSGKASGKLIFKAMKRLGISSRLLAHGADNTSSNLVQNRAIAKRVRKAHGKHMDATNLHVGCYGHVLHLSAQAILSGLGAAPDPEQEDLYEGARAFPLAYQEEDEEHVAPDPVEAADDAQSALDSVELVVPPASDSESDDSESEAPPASQNTAKRAVAGAPAAPTPPGKKKLSPVAKIHLIVVDLCRSDIRRGRAHQMVQDMCPPACHNLAFIRGMPVRWNTTYMEIERAILLKRALNHYVESLDSGDNLTSAQRRQGKKKKALWTLESKDWALLERVCSILKKYHEATLDLSLTGVPTICKILPISKEIQQHLQSTIDAFVKELVENGEEDIFGLVPALNLGLDKVNKYLERSLSGHFPILGAVLHPSIRIKYFEDEESWDSSVAARARVLLEHLFVEYSEHAPESILAAAATVKPKLRGIFAQAIRPSSATSAGSAIKTSEMDQYFAGLYPCDDHDALKWWKVYQSQFPVLSRIARDILAVPGVSISVERLFSSSKHTLSETRSSLKASSASKTVVAKEWLKRGLGDGVDYLQGVSTVRS